MSHLHAAIFVLATILASLAQAGGTAPQTHAIVYPASDGETASDDYTVKVDGKAVFVYRARVSAVPFNQVWPGYQRPLDQTELAAFAGWDMAGPVTVEVRPKRPVKTVDIRPTAAGIRPTVEGNRIVFRLARPRPLTVEVNGTSHSLHLFASPPEKDAPATGAPGVRYFGPGVHVAGEIALKSHERVYLAGGAVVHGFITANGATDIWIGGRGVLDGSRYRRIRRFEGSGLIALHDCVKVRVEGLVLRDPDLWTVIIAGCRDVSVDGLKLIGLWRYNSDGIDVNNSQDVTIARCFIRSFDDSVVIHGWYPPRGYALKPPPEMTGERTGILFFYPDRPVRNVTVENCVIWNDWGGALRFGPTWSSEIGNVIFRDCDVIRTGNAVVLLTHSERADIHDIRFENIRAEIDGQAYPPRLQSAPNEKYNLKQTAYCPTLIAVTIRSRSFYDGSPALGSPAGNTHGGIRNLSFKNILVTGKLFPGSHLAGLDGEHAIEGVTIENLRVNGKPVRNAAEGRIHIGPHVKDVKFAAGTGE